jgi:hypothetical protein
MKTSLLAGLMTAGLVSAGAMLSSAPAEAFTLSGGNVLNITSEDVGSSFDVIFDHGVGESLSARVKATSLPRPRVSGFPLACIIHKVTERLVIPA